ncbi:MAG TPA: lipopolysaccharide kinase InaA family protein [Candidatus Binataceae bacterium]|nr:lipopolysaccharide kinase InaA family protein [Candidatus Binataceae bacterium]
MDSAIGASAGTLQRRVRRSRAAETWAARIGGPNGPIAYFKLLDPVRGLRSLKRRLHAEGAYHVAAISEALRRDGFDVPEVMLIGSEFRGGREIIVTRKVEGVMPSRYLRERRGGIAGKRMILRALGAELSRLHRAGYLHGDLTPYNLLITSETPPRFAFIDHERTRKTMHSRFERMRLRNLVQLGHLQLPNLTKTDRMRVWHGYEEGINPERRRAAMRRVAAMIRARITRDRDRTERGAAVMARRGEAEGA